MSRLKPPTAGSVQSFALRREDAVLRGHFACVGTEAYAALRDRATEILHPAELAYFQPLPAERRRVSFLLGRYTAKAALWAEVDAPGFPAISIVAGVFKNPVVCFPMSQPWGVSITHSDAVVAALAFPAVHPMALDVETIDADRARVMATQCSASERQELGQLGLTEVVACTVLWTAKEAVSKAIGTGMTCAFDVLAAQAVRRLGDGSFQGLFRALGQYQFRAWILDDLVLAIVLPKKTEIEFAGGGPLLASAANSSLPTFQ